MAIILGTIFIGIAYLAVNLHVVYWESQGNCAVAVIDQLSGTVFGKSGLGSIFYNLTQFSTALILLVAAQTSFADFPRVTSILARDGFMPRQLSNLGDRLAFDNGVIALGVLSSLFIIAKKGSVDLLIPFFTIGVFQAFTLSQFGMVKHWFKLKGPRWQLKAFLNGLGGLATLIVFIDIIAEKFWDGAWFIIILIGILVLIFNKISQYYREVTESLALPNTIGPVLPIKNHVLVLIQAIHAGTVESVRYAESICKDCQAVYVEIDPEKTEPLKERWKILFPEIELVVLPSPYRSLLQPLLSYIDSIETKAPDEKITAIIGEFAANRWWQTLLQGNTGLLLKVALLTRPEIVVTNVRYTITARQSMHSP
jgi:Amino acid permease